MRTAVLVVAFAAALAPALAGCVNTVGGIPEAGDPARPAPATTEEAVPTDEPGEPEEPAPDLNGRGLVPMRLGQEGSLTDDAGRTRAAFTLQSIQVDPPCHEFGIRPESGHTLVLTVAVSTSSDAEAAQTIGYLLNPLNFQEIGKDGVTRPAQLGGCLEFTGRLPLDFGINQKYSGIIELVVPEASGTLALQDTLIDSISGWEWTYPR